MNGLHGTCLWCRLPVSWDSDRGARHRKRSSPGRLGFAGERGRGGAARPLTPGVLRREPVGRSLPAPGSKIATIKGDQGHGSVRIMRWRRWSMGDQPTEPGRDNDRPLDYVRHLRRIGATLKFGAT